MGKLRPLHQRLGKPRPGDWLDRHKEPGQSFAEYLSADPITPRGKRRVIYVLPLGDFTKTQRRVVDLAAEFLCLYYNRPVKVQESVPLSRVPEDARRVHPQWGDHQILTTYVLTGILRPGLPDDAAAYIALTASDLWPGRGWNFVFGQASLRERVGVWSLYRNGDPGKDDEAFRLCLLRTLKTASHELGHMFSMQHCILYECNMCGSNHRAESDRRPLAACPECLAKICWATASSPLARYQQLAKFCRREHLDLEAAFFTKSAEALQAR
jgi:archaemetzincin